MPAAHENPFATHRLQGLHFSLPSMMEWEMLHVRLREYRCRGAIIGPKGHGKTTLLKDLERQFTEQGAAVIRTRLQSSDRWWHRRFLTALLQVFRRRCVWLLDSAGVLPRWFLFFLIQASRVLPGFIITAHRPTGLPTLLECRTSPALLAELVWQLDEAHSGDYADLLPELYHSHDGNIRDCLLVLYDRVAIGN